MGETTGISYAHHSFSPWWNCTKVSLGCLNCYAEKVGARRGIKWGKGEPRVLVAESTWKQPPKWARAARKMGEHRRVLVSMCDYLDPEAPKEWRERFYGLIRETCDALNWMLLTKRSELLEEVPVDISLVSWMGVTVESGAYAYRISDLRRVPAEKTWISYEPAVGPLDLTPHLRYAPRMEGLDWVVAGCESGHGARPAEEAWFRSARDACVKSDVLFYLKQMMVDGKLTKLPALDGQKWEEMP